MITLKSILCPTDLSTESDEALRYALAFARAYKAKLFLVYCRRPGSVVEWANGSRARKLFTASLFNHLDANELKQLDWEAIVTEGDDVGAKITEEASKRNVDLIVMRSRRRPRAAVLLGSTAESVTRNASCPVLVTHPNEREWVGLTAGEIDLRRLLVAYDNSSDADVALRFGLSMAQQYQTEVHLLHVLPQENLLASELAWADEAEREDSCTIAADRLQQVISKEVSLWCRIVTAVKCGLPAEEILAYAKEHEIDLICMGAGGERFSLSALIGSTVDRVLRRAPCPVFVARSLKSAVASRAA